jgi:arylsulfatase A-like enzyme
MTKKAKNILFIMFDQLRFDYLSCAGHPTLMTPNIDRLASMGVRFNRAYVQSTICGSSRMSYYTGRYVDSHGCGANTVPLKVGELTLGDHLRPLGMKTVLVGKTHMRADAEGMARLGLRPDSEIGARVAECGFDIYERDDGLLPEGPKGFYDPAGLKTSYNEYLREKGYESHNPWHDFANSAITDDGELASGWFMKYADKPANIEEEHSETPYLTRRGLEFIEQAGDEPWCMHLSFIKPHWPYIVPAPYHSMYSHNEVLPVVRSEQEKENTHPVLASFTENPVAVAFARDDVRAKVVPTYMGLVKQIDDQMGVLFKYLEDTGRMVDTMIVLTSDHGDYLGDHWLGEKELFHECSVKVPMIIYDPSEKADNTRGTVCEDLIEAIDLAATFVDYAGGKVPEHILEGKSLRPFLEGNKPEEWRDYVISEMDFSQNLVAKKHNLKPKDSRMIMIADKRWKYTFFDAFRPMLFDLENDPNEFTDLATDPAYTHIIEMMEKRMAKWSRRFAQRTTITDEEFLRKRGNSKESGVLIGIVDEADLDERYTKPYTGKIRQSAGSS